MLIQQDPSGSCGYVCEVLEKLGHRSVVVESATEVLTALQKHEVDLVFIDSEDCATAAASLATIKTGGADTIPVVVASRTAGSDDIIEAMRLGAVDHLNKPLASAELENILLRALNRPKSSRSGGETTSGLSPVMRELNKLIGIAAACDATVLIQGETGSGKDTAARNIHKHSRHSGSPLTVIDCTAVPEDYQTFRSLGPGARGTVILDEIGDLNSQMQAMLMRALKEDGDEKPRIIATTQHDLINRVKEKSFREDLFYRLNVLPIKLPPLRERGSDVLVLAETFLEQAGAGKNLRLSSAAAKVLLDYEWPGNVRELENLAYHLSAIVRSPVVEASDLPGRMLPAEANSAVQSQPTNGDGTLDYYQAMNALEKSLLERALKEAHGNRAEAARLLGINRQLLYAKLKTHALMSD
ncbi:MAG: sigma-54-dependent Fis family transcriptional regulator [Cyanobacteria bacterium SZAS TMP-1]|nr:sigma-54-dependent Fis family transcriptional regulator [Cyanobacteria bacterium SZAS TMP-1]